MKKITREARKISICALLLSIFTISPVFAKASTLDIECPSRSDSIEFSCTIKGYSDTPITSITANIKSETAEYVSSQTGEDSDFTIETSGSSINVTSTKPFSGSFTVGEITFESTKTSSASQAETANTIELSLVIFNNGANTSFTAIGSTAQVFTPTTVSEPVPPQDDPNPPTDIVQEEQDGPSLLLIILIILIVLVVVVLIILVTTRNNKPAKPTPQPMQPVRPPMPQIAPVQPQPTPAPQPTPTPQPQMPRPIPEVNKPTGISVENLPFEKASSDNPISFES